MSKVVELADNLEKIYPDLSYKKQLEIAKELRRLAEIERKYNDIMEQEPFCVVKDMLNGCVFLANSNGGACNLFGKGGTKLYTLPKD